MKKILLLGGSAQQIVAIKAAKKLGYYTVLCDYLEDNPGQYCADKFYLVSTTDFEKVLEVASTEKIDGILAYASDPAAPTAAFVAEKLGLSGNPYKAVNILCNKGNFREFLKNNGFNTPFAKTYISEDAAVSDIKLGKFKLPVIVKPVDSSGSKGVGIITDTEEALNRAKDAIQYSRCKAIIVEEYVKKSGYQVAGDGMSIDGELVFTCFGNDHFNVDGANPFVPISASFPCCMTEEIQSKICVELQRLISLLEMKSCTYNFDIRVDEDMNIYLMEVAPRDGGNYIPDIIRYSTGVDLVECSVMLAMGERVDFKGKISQKGCWSYFAVHSEKSGVLKKLTIREDVLRNNVVENHINKSVGDRVSAFTGANAALGCLVMQFDSIEQMLELMNDSKQWLDIELEDEP